MNGKRIRFFVRTAAVAAGLGLAVGLLAFAASGAQEKAEGPVWDKRYRWMKWGESYWPAKPVRGGIFRRAAARYVGKLNPNHWPVNDWAAISLIYEGITGSDGQHKQKNPWLLHSWTYPQPDILIMRLKKGIRFHDGSPFNAPGLKYQVDWMRDRRNGCWTRGELRRFKSVEVIDDHTLRWICKEPWGSFPTGFFGFVISAEALRGDVAIREAAVADRKAKRARRRAERALMNAKKVEGKGLPEAGKARARAQREERKARMLEQAALKVKMLAAGRKSTDIHPVGTGPYMIDEARPGNYLKLKRNPDWWFGQSVGRPEMPYFDGIKIVVIPDPSIQVANLRAGKLDSVVLSKSHYEILKRDPGYRVYVFPHNTVRGLGFNQSRGPCRDIRVRKAVSYAIDRKALISGTQFGLAREANCFIPMDHWANNRSLKPIPFDPELSKSLLVEAGYKDGLALKGFMGSDPDNQSRTEAIKDMLAKVGIDWKVEALSPAASADRMGKLDYDLCQLDFGYVQDPDSFLHWFYTPKGNFNRGRNRNQRILPLIEAGRREIDDSKRAKIYAEIQRILYENYEDVWLYQEMVAVAYSKSVQGFNLEMYLKDGNLYTYSHPLWFAQGHP